MLIDHSVPDKWASLSRKQLIAIATEYRSERDAAKADALRAFDERNVALDSLDAAKVDAEKWQKCAHTLSEALDKDDAEIVELHAAADVLESTLAKERAEREQLIKFYNGVGDCMDDTWQCPRCGHAEDWWHESNADFATRDAVATLRTEPKEECKTC